MDFYNILRKIFTFHFLLTTWISTSFCLLRLKPSSSNFTRALGTSLVITCEYQSTSKVENLIWMKNNKTEIRPGQGRVFTEQDTDSILKLYITSIDNSDSGEYECYGGAHVQRVYLHLFKDITFESASPFQHPVLYKDAFIECIATGQPAPDISWKYKEKRILTGGRYTIIDKGLNIKNISQMDNGIYACRAEVDSEGRYDERRINVTVYVPPQITRPIGKLDLVSTKSEILNCKASGIPQPIFSFSRNGVLLTNSTLMKINPFIGTLEFLNISKQDEGSYECVATNDAGNASDLAFIYVLVPPIVTLLENVTGSEGGTVELICEIMADPKAEISFYKSNNPIQIEDDQRISLTRLPDSLTLIILPLLINDTDIYTCVASNSVGMTEKKSFIVVQYKPRFSSIPAKIVYGWAGHSSRLLCQFSSEPTAISTWILDGSPLVSDGIRFVITSTTMFTELMITVDKRKNEKNIFHEYECVLSNTIGSIRHTFLFEEAFVPDSPQVEVTTQRADEVILSVTTKVYEGVMKVLKYVVEYATIAIEFTNQPNSTSRNLYIDGLVSNTSYIFQIRAINEVGSSSATIVHTVTDTIKEPDQMQINSSFSGTNAYVYTVSWLPNYHGGSSILSLKIKIRKMLMNDVGKFEVQSDWNEININPFSAVNNQYLIEDLRPDTYYQVEVTALNAFGRSRPNSEFYFKTASGEVSLFPALLHTTSTSLLALSILIAIILFLIVIDIACYRINGCGISSIICTKICHRELTLPNKNAGTNEKEKLPENAPIIENINVVLRNEPVQQELEPQQFVPQQLEPQQIEPLLSEKAPEHDEFLKLGSEDARIQEPDLIVPNNRKSIMSGYGDARWMDVVHELEFQLGTKKKDDGMDRSVHESVPEDDEDEYFGSESPKWTIPQKSNFQFS